MCGPRGHLEQLADMYDSLTAELKAKDKAQVFVDHIQAHLQRHDFVVCKICGKTINEIWHAEQALKG
jgi:UDP-N-acetylglucosamine:LPS N-acetylglucosamine transferase